MVRHRSDIQGLRAVAVLLVALGHAGVPFLKGGYVGVDVFFVLSGFLITGILLCRRRSSAGHVSLVALLRPPRAANPPGRRADARGDEHRGPSPPQLRSRARGGRRTASGRRSSPPTSTSRTREATTSQQGQPPSPIQHFWSLSVEEQFYLVWPSVLALVLFGLFGRGARAALGAARCVVVASCGGRVARLVDPLHGGLADRRVLLDASHARGSSRSARRSPSARSTARRGSRRRLQRRAWAGPASARSRAPPFSISDGTAFPGYAALLPAVGAALVIAAGLGTGRPARRRPHPLARAAPLRRRPLVRLLPLALAGADHRRPVRGPRPVARR